MQKQEEVMDLNCKGCKKRLTLMMTKDNQMV